MTTLLPIRCEEITVDDFIESWRSFLDTLRDQGHRWIAERDGSLAEDLHRMWDRVLGELIRRAAEIGPVIDPKRDREMLCRIIWGIGAWDPGGPFGGIGGGVPGTFVSARIIKEAIERWLGPRMSSDSRYHPLLEHLRALNQLLCMLRCL